MTEVQREIDEVYKLVSVVQVSGDAVDIMASAREHLRRAYAMTKEPDTEEASDG